MSCHTGWYNRWQARENWPPSVNAGRKMRGKIVSEIGLPVTDEQNMQQRLRKTSPYPIIRLLNAERCNKVQLVIVYKLGFFSLVVKENSILLMIARSRCHEFNFSITIVVSNKEFVLSTITPWLEKRAFKSGHLSLHVVLVRLWCAFLVELFWYKEILKIFLSSLYCIKKKLCRLFAIQKRHQQSETVHIHLTKIILLRNSW